MASTSTMSEDPAADLPETPCSEPWCLRASPTDAAGGRDDRLSLPPGIKLTWLVSGPSGRAARADVECIVMAVFDAPMRPSPVFRGVPCSKAI